MGEQTPADIAASQEKTCPQCAEAVKQAARVCRYCGWDFALPSHVGPKRQITSRQQAILLVVVFAMLPVGVWVKGLIDDARLPAPVPVALPELEREFDSDPQAALEHWRGRPMLLSAVVNSPYGDELLLETVNILPVRAQMRSQVYASEGAKVVLHCRDIEIGGVLNDKPQPLDCDLVSGENL